MHETLAAYVVIQKLEEFGAVYRNNKHGQVLYSKKFRDKKWKNQNVAFMVRINEIHVIRGAGDLVLELCVGSEWDFLPVEKIPYSDPDLFSKLRGYLT
jgi:hypothetical protein